MKNIKEIYNFLDLLDQRDLYPDIKIIEGGADPEVFINGKRVLMFSSNNYLSLATHHFVIEKTIEAIKKYGVGSGGSRLLSGNLKIFRDLEEALVKFKGGEDAIVWPCGYSANVGIITAIMNKQLIKNSQLFKFWQINFWQRRGVILSDHLNHASIIDGCRMSKQKIIPYRHLDMNHLEHLLKKYKNRFKMIVTDGVFSMDGDIAPLDKISFLAKKI